MTNQPYSQEDWLNHSLVISVLIAVAVVYHFSDGWVLHAIFGEIGRRMHTTDMAPQEIRFTEWAVVVLMLSLIIYPFLLGLRGLVRSSRNTIWMRRRPR